MGTVQAETFRVSDDPLALVVEIGPGGKLSLNRIETGTIGDAVALRDKLKLVFADRERTGVAERKVYVFPSSKIERRDLEDLIEKLSEADALPIVLVDQLKK